jgi:hypothetical protein
MDYGNKLRSLLRVFTFSSLVKLGEVTKYYTTVKSGIEYLSHTRRTHHCNRGQGGSNMTGTNCDLFTHKQSRSCLNHLVLILHLFLSLSVPSSFPLVTCWWCSAPIDVFTRHVKVKVFVSAARNILFLWLAKIWDTRLVYSNSAGHRYRTVQNP